MSIIQYAVRSYLENEAMSKAIYVAKDYMEEYMKKSLYSKEKEFQVQNIPEQKSYAKGALEIVLQKKIYKLLLKIVKY